MPYKSEFKNTYIRSPLAMLFGSAEMYLVDAENFQGQKEPAVVPPIGKAGGGVSMIYREAHVIGEHPILTSGALRLFGGYQSDQGVADDYGGWYMGMLMRDAAVGQRAMWATAGKMMLPCIDVHSPNGSLPAGLVPTANLTAGKDAFLYVDEVTGFLGVSHQQSPIFKNGIKIGRFLDDPKWQPGNINHGGRWVLVDVQKQFGQNPIPSPTAYSETVQNTALENAYLSVNPEVVSIDNLTVDFRANAYTGNPSFHVKTIRWNFTGAQSGSDYVTEGSESNLSYTFGATGNHIVRLQVEANNGDVLNRAFQLTIPASGGQPTFKPITDTLENATILNMPVPFIKDINLDTANGVMQILFSHKSIVDDIQYLEGDAFSQAQFAALIDSLAWTVPAQATDESFVSGAAASDAILALSIPDADTDFQVLLTVDSTSGNSSSNGATIDFTVDANGVIIKSLEFSKVLITDNQAAATHFDFTGQAETKNVTVTGHKHVYDTGGTPSNDLTESADHDFTASGPYGCRYTAATAYGALDTSYIDYDLNVL